MKNVLVLRSMRMCLLISCIVAMFATVNALNIPKPLKKMDLRGKLTLKKPGGENKLVDFKLDLRSGFFRKVPHWRITHEGKSYYGPIDVQQVHDYYEVTFYHLEKKYKSSVFKNPSSGNKWFAVRTPVTVLDAGQSVIASREGVDDTVSKIFSSATGANIPAFVMYGDGKGRDFLSGFIVRSIHISK